MLTGILALGCGYDTGDNLIPANKNNPKGFFERKDVVMQNTKFLSSPRGGQRERIQGERIQGYRARNNSSSLLVHNHTALAFFNQNSTIPWIQKDPRMCLTLNKWLPYIHTEPAVLLTYRHPLEVARSINKRNNRKSIAYGLQKWILHNEAAIRNSVGMCRVVTSNDRILQSPVEEVTRIVQELTDRCNVMSPPRRLPSESVVNDFVDVTLQRSKTDNVPTCNQTSFDAKSLGLTLDVQRLRLEQAMKLYCDMESGQAFVDS